MKSILLGVVLISTVINARAQTCEEVMDFVKSKSYGTTYNSYNSDAISSVTFYDVMIEFQTYYFAVVNFKGNYTDYIYQVSSSTESSYSINYLNSAGEAFWSYIQPYNRNLGCAPNFSK